VLLTAADVAAAAEFLGMDTRTLIQKHAALAPNRAQLALQETPDGACVFLDPAGRCQIYPARPQQCRDFPHGWRVAGCPAAGATET